MTSGGQSGYRYIRMEITKDQGMEFVGQSLTGCEIDPRDGAVRVGFLDESGKPSVMRLSLDNAGALAMTLPAVVEAAIRLRYRDDSLRYTYPLGSWALEQATDGRTRMMTLRTPDGFGVCFAVPPAQAVELGRSLADGRTATLAPAN